MKDTTPISRWPGRIQKQLFSPVVGLLLALPILLLLGVAIGLLNPAYALAMGGATALIIMGMFRLDELTVTLIIAVHIWVDSYLGLYQVALLMALVLLFVCYCGRSAAHPWSRPRSIWLWILFLLLTIYPTISGGAFSITNSGSYYVNLVFNAFIMFWLGNTVANDMPAVRRTFQLLSLLAAFIALHTIIEATTGIFLFESAQAEAALAQYSNFQIMGSGISRAGSFLGNPNGNATFLVTCLFLPPGLLFESKQLWAKLLYLAEMLVILLALMFTYSTGAWIAAAAGIGAFLFLTGRLRHSVVLLLLIVAVPAIIFTVFPTQIAAQFNHATNEGDLSLHLGAWQTAMRVIQAFPLFGIGMGSQAYLFRADPFRVPTQTIPLQEPDNSYLQLGAMAGIPAMLVFLLLLGCALWFAWRNWRISDTRYRVLLGGGITSLIALSLNSLTVDGWTNPVGLVNLGWLIAGLVASPLLERWLSQSDEPQVKQTAKIAPIKAEAARIHNARQDVRDA